MPAFTGASIKDAYASFISTILSCKKDKSLREREGRLKAKFTQGEFLQGDKMRILATIAALIIVVMPLALVATAAYVIIHFIQKFW